MYYKFVYIATFDNPQMLVFVPFSPVLAESYTFCQFNDSFVTMLFWGAVRLFWLFFLILPKNYYFCSM